MSYVMRQIITLKCNITFMITIDKEHIQYFIHLAHYFKENVV